MINFYFQYYFYHSIVVWKLKLNFIIVTEFRLFPINIVSPNRRQNTVNVYGCIKRIEGSKVFFSVKNQVYASKRFTNTTFT